jgi:hypothetical protein
VQESEDFDVFEKKIIEVGPANLVYMSWLLGLLEGGSMETLHLLMQASQDYSIDSSPKFGHRNISVDNIRHFSSAFIWIMCSNLQEFPHKAKHTLFFWF